jgi:uroporphyrinogen-III synthase
MRRVLILRPEPGASATLQRARGEGLNAVAVPLFDVEPTDWELPEPSGFDGLLLTSANAVRHGGEQLQQLRGLKVYAVGSATADAAREAGFDIASTGDSGVERLLGSIEPDVRLLHLAGENRKDAAQARQDIRTITVYRSRPKDRVDLREAKGSLALIHSPRAGSRFAELVQGSDKSSIRIAAISREAAHASGSGWAIVEAAEASTDEALLALAKRLCDKSPPK